ncbi:MAG: hypothetical protein CM15mV8_0240 [Caudoviricetes sp.]|nr:MAG: hypothetical protein CM15mV8_0240 [Caudoviricetes sp.]
MAGTCYSADTSLDTNGENLEISGSVSVASASAAVTGFGTRFTTELKNGDSISFINDSGNTETKIIEAIINDNSLTLSDNAAAIQLKLL